MVVFNRLDEVRKSLNAIRNLKPKHFYVYSDGPRENIPSDKLKVINVRNYIKSMIDWDTNFIFLCSNKNVGCDKAVVSGINKMFKDHEFGIILEDDCIATPNFFNFCQILLYKFKHDKRIGMICGTNHISKEIKLNTYFFSRNYACWGWATWRRAWNLYDQDMDWRSSNQSFDIKRNIGQGFWSYIHYLICLRMIDNTDVEAWDWQWYFTLSSQNMLSIFPSKNLVHNIGFNNNATHTRWYNKSYEVKNQSDSTFINKKLVHPKYVLPNHLYDKKFVIKKHFPTVFKYIFPKFIKNYIKSKIGYYDSKKNQN